MEVLCLLSCLHLGTECLACLVHSSYTLVHTYSRIQMDKKEAARRRDVLHRRFEFEEVRVRTETPLVD